MKKRLLLFCCAYILTSFFLTGCQTIKHTQPAVASKSSTGPKFIDSVYIKAHNAHKAVAMVEQTIATINTIPSSSPTTAEKWLTEAPKFITYTNTAVPVDIQPAPSRQKPSKAHKEMNEPERDTIATKEQATTDPAQLAPDESDTIITRYAQMIAMDPKDMSNIPLYKFVDEWYGTAYKWGGTDIDGIDCSGFSQKLYEDIYGVDLLRTVREQHKTCDRIRRVADAAQGDLVFFRIHRFRISHVGVYLANGYFVHASSSRGVVISNINDRYWHRRFAGCGRIDKSSGVSESEYIP